jgi:hypothetical protein
MDDKEQPYQKLPCSQPVRRPRISLRESIKMNFALPSIMSLGEVVYIENEPLAYGKITNASDGTSFTPKANSLR